MIARKLAILLDRTAVLFVGLALGGVITFSFFASSEPTSASGPAPGVRQDSAAAAPAAGGAPAPVPFQAVAPGARLAAAAAEGRPIHVGVFGDSFGDGIWSALYRQLPADQNFRVHQFSHQATGFTRYRTTNLLDDTREKFERQPVDIAVLSFGANDMQGIFHEGRGAEFMSERWQQIVTERVGAVISYLRDRGVTVYWVGLPRMREADYDADVQRMHAFYTERMRTLGVPYVDTRAMTVDASGGFAPYLTDPRSGERINARTNDGIHMTIPGYAILTRGLADRIRASVGEARAQAGGGARQAEGGGSEGAGASGAGTRG